MQLPALLKAPGWSKCWALMAEAFSSLQDQTPTGVQRHRYSVIKKLSLASPVGLFPGALRLRFYNISMALADLLIPHQNDGLFIISLHECSLLNCIIDYSFIEHSPQAKKTTLSNSCRSSVTRGAGGGGGGLVFCVLPSLGWSIRTELRKCHSVKWPADAAILVPQGKGYVVPQSKQATPHVRPCAPSRWCLIRR